MSAKPIAFLDCETTSLRPDRRAWDIAVIIRSPGSPDNALHWYVADCDLDLGNADPMSLRVGRFYERHPDIIQFDVDPFGPAHNCREAYILDELERMTRGAIIYGSNPAFDVATLDARMRANGICPSWHYHPQDVPSMAVGWLRGRGLKVPEPSNSENLSLAVGVDPGKYDRHTAMGDCEWMRDLYDEIAGVRQ